MEINTTTGNDTALGRWVPPGGHVIKIVVFLTGCILAIVGNTLVLVTIYKRPVLWRIPFYLVSTLAAEDLLMAVSLGVHHAQALILEDWRLGDAGCVVFACLAHWLGATEVFLMAVMSLDRYVACCKPLRYPIIVTLARCKAVIVSVWVLAFLASLMPIFGCGSYKYNGYLQACQLEWSMRSLVKACVFSFFTLPFAISTLAMVVCQYKILKQACKVSHSHHVGDISLTTRHLPNKATVTVTLMTGVYLLCWLPLLVVRSSALFLDWKKSHDSEQTLGMLETITLYIYLVSKFVNPIIYGVYNHQFRHECLKIFRRCECLFSF